MNRIVTRLAITAAALAGATAAVAALLAARKREPRRADRPGMGGPGDGEGRRTEPEGGMDGRQDVHEHEGRTATGEAGGLGGAEIHLPAPSVWPVMLALGVTLLMFGIVTSYAFTAVGALMMAVALAGWIRELRHG